MSTKILVTGGAGFMGSNFIRHLYKTYPSYQIWNYDLLTYAGNLANLSDIEKQEKSSKRKRYFFVRGDIRDRRALHALFLREKFDYVVNFAAESHVDRSIISAEEFITTNVGGVYTLLDLFHKHRLGRFIQISTDEIYGDVARGRSRETSPIRPSNPYAASKAGADILVQSYMRTHEVPALIVRGSNNFGPYQYPEKLIPLAITNLLDGSPVPIHGNGRHLRTWIHVNDFCSALDLILHKGQENDIYNIAGSLEENITIIEMIAQFLGRELVTHTVHVSDRPGADLRYAPDATKLKRQLGWKPTHTLAKNLSDLVEWYRANESWWRRIKEKKDFTNHYKRQSRGEYY